MFISVSNNLPKTSYIKMVDVWLLFNLIYPFSVVLLHTYMDTLRSDDEAIVSDSEKKDRCARKLYLMQRMSLVYIPGFCLIFCVIYWTIGLRQADAI